MSHFKVAEFLAELHRLDIQVQVEGERLKLNAPKGAVTPELRERLKQHKADIIRFYQQQAGNRNGIPRLSREQPLPCSFAQQRLWLLDRLEPGSHAYNIPVFLRASGKLDVPVFRRAVNEIIRRHESLRTVFREPPDGSDAAVQIILPELTIDIPLIDLSTLSEQEAETRVREQAARDATTPFELEQPPLLRLNILQISGQDHVLLFTLHHSIFDGLSLAVFLRELGALYQAFARQQASPLPELEVQYADFSGWQRQRLSGDDWQEQLDFWRKELADAPPVIGLPTDHPRPVLQSHAGARQSLEIGRETTRQFRQITRQNGATLFMTFHAVLTILLARHTGKDDIVIGTPIANRNHRQLESLIGFFANTLVLRTAVKPDDNFNELLERIKHHALQAYRHQEVPFEKLVDELAIERSTSHSPLFQVMLSFQNAHTDGFTLPGVDILPLDFDGAVARFDLSFIIREHPEKFTVILEYSTALFAAATIERMMGHFQVLLDAILEQPDLPISQLSMLTQQDVQQLQAWNDTAVAYPLEKTLVDLFEAQVGQTPDNVALTFHEQRFTYRQLNQQANQIAHYLLQNTSCKNQHNPLIAICVERSPDMLFGLLGTLKAGAAYVPIDPAYPQDRIHHMLTDSEATVILTHSSLKSSLSVDSTETSPQVVCLDEVTLADFPTDNLPVRSQPDDLAYVIYTSGSTGKPKGVAVEHQNVIAMLVAYEHTAPRLTPISSSSVCPFVFDVSVWECFSSLCYGHELHIIPTEIVMAPDNLVAYLCEHAICQAYIPPNILEMILVYFEEARQLPLRYLLVGVEPIHEELLQRFRKLEPDLSIINGYGPTETTVCATFHDFKNTQNPSRNTPIGRALANYRVYLCDTQSQPVPIGVSGEIYIAGDGVARNYHKRPQLTAEKFIELELLGRRERVYKTGDLARWLPDGNLEFLGRIDHQIKLRGFRIELGEIEAQLKQCPNIGEAVVVTHPIKSGDKQLVAYVLAQVSATKHNSEIVSELKSTLKQKLPDYMIPALFIVLDEFPRLPNGKLDRKSLPEPDQLSVLSTNYMHPRNSLELQLSQIWEDTLAISPISVLDNFFAIGGDSMLAIRLINRINQQFSVKIPLNTLFQYANIEQFACLLRRDDHVALKNSPLVALQTRGSNIPIFCVHAAGGIVFRYQQVAKLMSSRYAYPFYGLQARGIEPGEPLYTSIDEMAQNYVDAIRQIKPQGPYLLAGWSFGGSVAFEMARILESTGETVSGVIMIDAPSPYVDTYETDDVDFLLERLEPAAGINIQEEVEQQESEHAQKQLIIEQKKQIGLFPPDITLEEAEQRLRVHKHHNQLLCQYRPNQAIKAGIAYIKATEETRFDEKMKDPVPAWAEFTHKGMIEHESPGNHFNMFSNEHSPVLAEKLYTCIHDLGVK
nr:non-ribosomal peptide synthetase [Thiothrix nivea]